MPRDDGIAQGAHEDEVRRLAGKFAERHLAPKAAARDHDDPSFPADIFRQGLAAGFDRFVLPERLGGHGFPMAALTSLVATLAETCAGHAMVFGVHAATLRAIAEALPEASGPEPTAALIERLCQAGEPLAVTLPEAIATGEFDATVTATETAADTVELAGELPLAFNVAPAATVVVFARSAAGGPLALLLAGEGQARWHGRPERTLGLRAMPVAQLSLPACAVPSSWLVAAGTAASRLYDRLVGNLSLVVAAAASGLMKQAHQRALTYAAERYQGGKMIIDHTHLREILGAMSTAVRASASVVAHAAGEPADERLSLAAKVSVTEDAVRTCSDAVQVLGGYGYMREFGVEKALRDAATLALLPMSNARARLLLAAADQAELAPSR
jgi:alkylation response protein AidB-like acyl-CoA dehydrogenase